MKKFGDDFNTQKVEGFAGIEKILPSKEMLSYWPFSVLYNYEKYRKHEKINQKKKCKVSKLRGYN